MKYVFSLFMISLFGCGSQIDNSAKVSIEFEDNYHYPYEIVPGKYRLIETQDQLNAVFSVIHKKNGGTRLAPIPSVNDEETYLIFKPLLKNKNDVEIKEIYTENSTLFVRVKEFDNPQTEESSRISPNILVKLLKKVATKKLIINDQLQ